MLTTLQIPEGQKTISFFLRSVEIAEHISTFGRTKLKLLLLINTFFFLESIKSVDHLATFWGTKYSNIDRIYTYIYKNLYNSLHFYHCLRKGLKC